MGSGGSGLVGASGLCCWMRFLRPGSVEVVRIRVEHAVELLLMEDEQMIEAFTSDTSQEPLTDGIGTRGV